MPLIVICGGIGSGKSVVSRVLRTMGYEVYDCDSRAKALMDTSSEIKKRISSEISTDCIAPDGSIDRPRLATIVFEHPEALTRLNAIVHSAVRYDIERWRGERLHTDATLFVETAIPFTSGLDRMADALWVVDAPVDLRLERVMARAGAKADRADAERRIAAQAAEYGPEKKHPVVAVIANDGVHPILPQIYRLLEF